MLLEFDAYYITDFFGLGKCDSLKKDVFGEW
jgi:hypothetical protein